MATTAAMRPRTSGDVFGLASSIAIALCAGLVGGLATAPNIATWYAGLHKPSFNPPNAIFGPVWTVLYVLMGIAAWRVWRTSRPRAPLVFYAVQLSLNLGWSLIFFGMHRPDVALAEIGVLLVMILATAAAFWRADHVAGLLLAPYAAWTAFASLLNYEIWRLN